MDGFKFIFWTNFYQFSDKTIEVLPFMLSICKKIMMQYVFQIKTLSRGTPSFQRWDWLKNERNSDVEIWWSVSITKYGKLMRWMRWTMIKKMNEMEVKDKLNDMDFGI